MNGHLFTGIFIAFSEAANVFRHEVPNSKLCDLVADIENKLQHNHFRHSKDASYVLVVMKDAKNILKKMIKELKKESFGYDRCNSLLRNLNNICRVEVEECMKKKGLSISMLRHIGVPFITTHNSR